MRPRTILWAFMLVGLAGFQTSALAQPYYGAPRYGGEYRDYPPQPRSRIIEDYPAVRPSYRSRRAPAYEPGRWDCNWNRCIDRATGALWESTCNYRGCFPLQPSRGYGW